jgi:hypothetical protein
MSLKYRIGKARRGAATQQALAADRFAHEIRAILARRLGLHPISIYRGGG